MALSLAACHWQARARRAVLRAILSHVSAGAGGRLIGPLPGTAELWHLASGTQAVTAVGLDSVGHEELLPDSPAAASSRAAAQAAPAWITVTATE